MSPVVTPLRCGTITLEHSLITGTNHGASLRIPSTVYLIEAESTILVDTSFGDPDRCSALHHDAERTPDERLPAVLAAEGYDPGDIDVVVLSHLHWDHCYNLDLLSEARIVVQRRELAYAIAPYDTDAVAYEAKSAGMRPPWLDVDLEAIEGETTLAPGVTAFPTPGHTVGLQSVAVETDRGTIVAAGDAIPTYDNITPKEHSEMRPGAAMDTHAWWQSAREIRERADEILPGHETDLFE